MIWVGFPNRDLGAGERTGMARPQAAAQLLIEARPDAWRGRGGRDPGHLVTPETFSKLLSFRSDGLQSKANRPKLESNRKERCESRT